VLLLISHYINLKYAELDYLSEFLGVYRRTPICLFFCDFIVLMRTVLRSAEEKRYQEDLTLGKIKKKLPACQSCSVSCRKWTTNV